MLNLLDRGATSMLLAKKYSKKMNKSTRFKSDPDRLFDCYCEVSLKSYESNGSTIKKPWIKRRFPDTYKVKEVLESVPKFVYPCDDLAADGATRFSFVLTNIDSKWTFGFCHIPPNADTRLVVLSQLPWHETFFEIVAYIGTIYNSASQQDELLNFLKSLYQRKIPEKSDVIGGGANKLVVEFPLDGQTRKRAFDVPDNYTLATIPQDGNLTIYYETISAENMITIFASALNERHILVTSKKLDRLSACVQALSTLLYPMHWQHIFIPILPSDLLAYLQAPMPFLIGVPDPTFKKLKLEELGEVVLVLADDDVVHTPHDDVKNLPPGILSQMRSDLKNESHRRDSLSRTFLMALVNIIGGYREALKFDAGEKITFNHDRFVETRPPTFRPFLKRMLELQMFRQFIECRLELLNAGHGPNDQFEYFVNLNEFSTGWVERQYQDWLESMKSKGGLLLRSINPSLRVMYKGLKDKSKQTYKDWKTKLKPEENQSSSQEVPSFFYSRMD